MPFNMALLNLPDYTGVPEFLDILNNKGNFVPYTRKQTLHITATFQCQKNYYDSACNIYCAVYDTLDAHIDDAFKIAPATTPPTMGWNVSIIINDIFDQMMWTYGRPTPDAMCQNMITYFSPYNPQDPQKPLFKRFAECQEFTIIANVKYIDKHLLTNVIDLLTR